MRQHILSLLLLCTMAVPAVAEERASAEAPPAPRAAVVVDEEAGVIRFIIEGKETMRLDAAGLHLVESITYGGMLTDAGRPWMKQFMAGEHDAQ